MDRRTDVAQTTNETKPTSTQMNPADLIQRLRDAGNRQKVDVWALCDEAVNALASKDTALAEIRADRDAAYKMLVIANAQLADMEFLTVEGFMGWKQDRASRAFSQEEGR